MAGYQINPDNKFEEKMRAVQFFNLYFAKFKYIVLSNLLFLVPLAIASGYVFAMYKIMDGLDVISAMASIIILNTGMSGVTQISRYIYTEKEFPVVKTFMKGVSENWLKFFIHGIVMYLFFAVSFSSLLLYYSGTKTNSLFWVPFVITALISLLVLFGLYYVNIMTVTMDIKLKDIYRNCALFSFGEIKNNFFATVALVIFSAIIFTIVVIFNNFLVTVIVLGLLSALIIPSTVQYIITFYVYDDMVAILDESRKKNTEDESETDEPKQIIEQEEAEEISRLAPDTNDEYIFHNGKMIKRSAVEKQLHEKLDDEFE